MEADPAEVKRRNEGQPVEAERAKKAVAVLKRQQREAASKITAKRASFVGHLEKGKVFF